MEGRRWRVDGRRWRVGGGEALAREVELTLLGVLGWQRRDGYGKRQEGQMDLLTLLIGSL